MGCIFDREESWVLQRYEDDPPDFENMSAVVFATAQMNFFVLPNQPKLAFRSHLNYAALFLGIFHTFF